MVVIQSNTISQESIYAYGILLGEFLGLEWRFEEANDDEIVITVEGQSGEVLLPNVFFLTSYMHWLSLDSLPKTPLEKWDTRELSNNITLVDPLIPVIFGNLKREGQIKNDSIYIPIDIFGSAFFMLSRYEESFDIELDKHNRFPASASLAMTEGFLDRPIIDEYTEILWVAISKLWPKLKRKARTNTIRVTCDVDSCYDLNFSNKGIIRGVAADLLKRNDFILALKGLKKRLDIRRGVFNKGSHLNNIYWMMDVNEAVGNRMVFYFLVANKHKLDANYDIHDPVVRRLMSEIHARGHEIGLHPSYETYHNEVQMENEMKLLISTMESEGIPFTNLGTRQHYLRWKSSETAYNIDFLGLKNDSTLCYADQAGFRCGTSREFSMYNLKDRKILGLKQRPLIVMETTIVSSEYVGLGYTKEALEYMNEFKQRAMRIGGEFTLLWHNSSFDNDNAYSMYESLIKNN